MASMKQPLGVTFNAKPGQSLTGVYESDNGVEVFETDAPYLLSDGRSLASPLPVFDAGGPTFTDGAGGLQAAMPVRGLVPPVWSPIDLFSTGQQGFWAGSLDPASGRMWQDSAGTTPVTASGQPVGLVFDTSKGAGTDLLPMGFYDPEWSLTGGAAIIDGVYVSPVGTESTGQRAISGPSSGWYHARVHRLTGFAGGFNIVMYVDGAGVSVGIGGAGAPSFRAVVGPAVGEATGIRIYHNGGGGEYHLDQMSVWHRPGFPASQATALSRPTLARWPKGGRRNLLTWTEDFSQPIWLKTGVTPVGRALTLTTADSGKRLIFPQFFAENTTVSVAFAKRTDNLRVVVGTHYGSWVPTKAVCVDLTTGSALVGSDYSVTDLITHWRITKVIQGLAGYQLMVGFLPPTWDGSGDPRSVTWVGDGQTVSLDDLQQEFGDATPYQRVTTQYDITEAGVPDVWHLSNDGGDSLPITLPAGTYGRARVNAAGLVTVDTVVDPTNALVSNQQVDVILRQGAFTPDEEAKIEAYWARYAA